MKISDLNTIGVNMMYKSTQTTIADTIVAANFANINTNEAFIQESVHHGIHMMGPLNFDIAGSNSYLLDNVSVNIRLELSKPSIVLLTDANFANNNTNEAFIQEKCPSWNSYDGTRQLFLVPKK